jgi:ribosomal protein S12 methylthiotransferase
MQINSTYYLLNLGCAKNLVEGEHLAGMLQAAGYAPVRETGEAELICVNTCGFIRPAVEEALGHVLALAKEKRPGQTLAVVGCLVGRYGKKLARELPEVDLLVGPGEVGRLVEHLRQAPPGRLAISPPTGILGLETPRRLATGPGWAYLRVADGCEHRCAFCAIPHIRGRLRSRGWAELVEEAAALAESGAVELNLVAQDLTSYGADLADGSSLKRLLEELDKISALKWIRLLYMHPDSLDQGLIEAMAGREKVLPYFDLPLQHVADPVLTAMRRRRSGAELRKLLRLVRQVMPQAVLRTTLLVGHPGEREDDFTELTDFLVEFEFDHLGCFAYQPEAGTASARLAAPEAKVGRARAKAVMARQKKISAHKLKALKGQTLPLLVLGPHPESELLGLGRLARQAPEVDGEVIITAGAAQPGSIALCRVGKTHAYDLEAELL